MIRLILLLIIVFIAMLLPAQNVNSPSDLNAEDEENIERNTERTGQLDDYTSLTEAQQSLKDHPVNINNPDEEGLRRLHLNDLQINNLEEYIKTYGPLSGMYELNLIEGFDSLLITHLIPYITFKPPNEIYPVTVPSLLKETKHMFLVRWQITPEDKAGYIGDNPAYAGGPAKELFKYAGRFHDRLRFGITMEKDAGESLSHGFDFRAVHFLYKGNGFINTIALGDYTLHFGQGLTLSNGFNFNVSPTSSMPIRQSTGITPATGAGESGTFRGGAVTLKPVRNTSLTLFFSTRRLDAHFNETDSLTVLNQNITTLYETGLHRTISELANKGTTRQTVYGGHLQTGYKRFKIGATALSTNFSSSLIPRTEPYNLFSFRGSKLLNYGIDGMLMFRYVTLGAEISGSDNGAKGMIASLAVQPSQSCGFTLLYRNYDRNYHNFFSNSYSENTSCRNEQGLYSGIFLNPCRGLMLVAYADHYRFPWLKYRVNHPSQGNEYALQVSYDQPSVASVMLKFSHRLRPSNEGNDVKNTIRLQWSYCPVKEVMLKNRIEYLKHTTLNAPAADGYLIYQDVTLQHDKSPVLINFRYALFDTDSFNESIYAYERDVLYAWSVPSYSFRGSRFYFMVKYSPVNCIDLWIRYSHDYYPGKATIGNGNEAITGNTRSEITLQGIVRL